MYIINYPYPNLSQPVNKNYSRMRFINKNAIFDIAGENR